MGDEIDGVKAAELQPLTGEELFEATVFRRDDGSIARVMVDEEEFALLPEYQSTLPTVALVDGKIEGVTRWKAMVRGVWCLGRYRLGATPGTIVTGGPTEIIRTRPSFLLGMVDVLRERILVREELPEAVRVSLDRGIICLRAAAAALGAGRDALRRELDDTLRMVNVFCDDLDQAETLLHAHGLLPELRKAREAASTLGQGVPDTRVSDGSDGDDDAAALRKAITHARAPSRTQLTAWLEELLRRRDEAVRMKAVNDRLGRLLDEADEA